MTQRNKLTRDKQRFGLKEISDKKLMDIKSNISAV